jgi:hypothetical protein
MSEQKQKPRIISKSVRKLDLVFKRQGFDINKIGDSLVEEVEKTVCEIVDSVLREIKTGQNKQINLLREQIKETKERI